jgi:hypothetical protein
MKEFWVYNLLRAGILLISTVTVITVWALVADSVPILWAFVVSMLLSGVVSFYVLGAQRRALALRVEERAQRMSAAFEERKAKEDVD